MVIRYNGAFFHDLTELTTVQQNAFRSYFRDGTYAYSDFKTHVQQALTASFGASVKPGKKAIKVSASGSRRNADVVVAFEYRRYYKFNGALDQSYTTGIVFFSSDGTQIANYPIQHSENCTRKHQDTGGKFKPAVRMFKNIRSKLVAEGMIGEGVAPSYYIEGLLYNVPNSAFTGSFSTTVCNVLTWLYQTTNRVPFVCANEQYYLMRDNDPVCWPAANGDEFISQAVQLWDYWS